jgi:hypothetical protein
VCEFIQVLSAAILGERSRQPLQEALPFRPSQGLTHVRGVIEGSVLAVVHSTFQILIFCSSAMREMFDSGTVCSERSAGGIVANVATSSSRSQAPSAHMHGLTPSMNPLQRSELSAKCHIRYDSSGCVRGSSIAVSMRSRGTTRGRPYKIHLHTGGAREMRENGGLEVCRIGVTCDHQGQLPQGAFADQTATPRKGYSLKLARSAGDRSM